jgi:transposase InsO family protein
VKYAFIRRHARLFTIARMCAVLGVSRSGYYEWRDRPESRRATQDRQLLQSIRAVHLESREAYGAYKTWRVLRARGVACGRHRVARLRRQNGIEARRKRRFRVVVEHHKLAPPAPNHLSRRFHVRERDRVWAGDMTVIPTAAGWLHLAVMLDLYSRRVVGWAMGNERGQALSLAALRMATAHRRPKAGLLHHSDQGSAYVGTLYQAQIAQLGAIASMSRKGNAYDNAVVESFFGNLKNELVHHRVFATREQARAEIFDYIEIFYTRQRAHASLQYVSPVDYENSMPVLEKICPENPG